jgi:hypothetical protein
MPAIANWTTEAKLAAMLEQGWTERDRRDIPEEGRTLLRLHHAGDRVETFRSLPFAAAGQQLSLV